MAACKNVIVVALGISINCINATMVHTFTKQQILNLNPRYILFIHLVINDMIQLTVSISLFLSSYIFYTISVPVCSILIMLAVFTTQNTPLNLAFMAVECYIAVCIPLRHAHLCTVKRTHVAIGLIWTMSVLSILPDLFILITTEPLEFFHARVFCARDMVFRSTYSITKRNASHTAFLVLVWLTLFYTYVNILFTAKAAKADAKKARNTILLHAFQLLLCMLNYVQPMLIQALMHLAPAAKVSTNFTSFIANQIIPRFVSPIIYGLRDNTFRTYFKKYFLCTVTIRTHPKTSVKMKSDNV
ncbi:odorant receptor 131-2-like [Myripristis murdjan]|uniref:odorant receptor 131-2-like n=1 Tax=Myripristis murdjan TaxID=586833 RepID=UPI0011760229|nr:odorant receptor 131-2-like [Myripristis murdjan]